MDRCKLRDLLVRARGASGSARQAGESAPIAQAWAMGVEPGFHPTVARVWALGVSSVSERPGIVAHRSEPHASPPGLQGVSP